MNITWLDINASYSHSSLALPALEAQLEPQTRKKCAINVVSGTIKTPIEKTIIEIIDSNPDYILATAWLFNINCLLSVLSRIHSINKNIKIVLGGPEFLGDNQEFLLKNRFVTAVFKGEAEEVFNDFIELASKDPDNLDWLKLNGFEYIADNIYHTSEPVAVNCFSKLAPPEDSQFFRWDKAFVQLETSRGCFNRCRFCVSGIGSAKIQDLPVGTIRERLQNISSKGIKEIRILDRTFNANSKRAVEMLSLFEEFAGRLKFHLEVHPALLSPAVKERILTLPEGLLHIEAGIQSLREEVIEACDRKGSCSKAIEGIQFLLSTGKFEVHTDFIAGLPGYTLEMLLEDVKAMIAIGPHEIQLESLKLLSGTHLKKYSDEYGIRYSPEPPYEVLATDSISYSETFLSKVLSKILEYWYNDPNWRETFRQIVMNDKNFLNDFISWLCSTSFYEKLYSHESKSLLLYNFCRIKKPEHLDLVILAWINSGLSLKKEPALGVVHWNMKDKEMVKNPIFDPQEFTNSYYYYDSQNVRYWFAFNKNKDRCKPIAHATQILKNCNHSI